MAKKKFLKGSEEWILFMDYWALCQELWETEAAESYWEDVVKKTEAFCEKHKGKFALSLATALSSELMRRSPEWR